MQCEEKMHFTQLIIENYKSFLDRETILLKSGFNIFLGKNNSGKTTAFELLQLPPSINDPHKSEQNLTSYGSVNSKPSRYEAEIFLSFEDLVRAFGENLQVPIPEGLLQSDQGANLQSEIKTNGINLKFEASSKIHARLGTKFGQSNPTSKEQVTPVMLVHANKEGSPTFQKSRSALVEPDAYKNLIYTFSALRTPNSQAHMEDEIKLRPNASNIAFCINHLQTKDAEGHKELCGLLNRIFPEVKWVQAPPIKNNQVELECLATSPEKRRPDLAVPLSKMGTGIGNVIAILYILLTSRYPQVIAIDEPHSFLHPKALRELLQILESHGKEHQYILTGHSPEVLTAIEPSTITYFEIIDSSTKIRQFTKSQYHEFRSELSDLGIRMTDLHAKDRVLWVEGQTEEIVFPKLLREYSPEISAGTAVLRVTHTGTFESSKVHINEVAKTYSRLTQTSLAPPMVAIILDREGRQPQDIQKIERENNKLLHFLPYRMIENYALDADAIHAVLKSYGIDSDPSKIEPYLPANTEGEETADGAKILKEIFTDLSNTTFEFRKTTHTPELFDWLLENKKDSLRPLEIFVKLVCTEDL